MIILISIAIGIFAAWRLTWDITSVERIRGEQGEPDTFEPNSEGPFRLYDGIRWLFRQDFTPAWAQRGALCPYCVSFWCSFFIALLLPVYDGMSGFDAFRFFIALGIGMSGVIAFWFRILINWYGIDAKEF